MPVDSHHAFADGSAYSKPGRANVGRLADRAGSIVAFALLRHRVTRAWKTFERGALIEQDCLLGPSAWCINRGEREKIRIGAGTVCRGVLRREHFGDGELRIGRRVYIGDDCIVSCCERIEIGDQTLLGHGVQIFDNNSHPLDVDAREADWSAIRDTGTRPQSSIERAPVSIGRGAWLGFGSTVLKGVTVGEGAIVAAGSVVTDDVEPFTAVAGNPAVPVKSLR
jgi:acetyltransferase-like isoleucine patch superfamily enzyme